MKVVILAGGLGTRLSEETYSTPKPLVEIGGKPILWHIMKHFAHHGHTEFYIALGYLGDRIKKYFLDYDYINSDLSLDFGAGKIKKLKEKKDKWKVNLIDTGSSTMTGGRILRMKPFIDEPFFMTYGDGVCNVDLDKLVKFHKSHKKHATVTAVRPQARFGAINFDSKSGRVDSFAEKSQTNEGWINGGFFVLEPQVFKHISGDDAVWEKDPMESLVRKDQLMAYQHGGFWHCMDTLRDKKALEELWHTNNPPWKVW